MGAEIIFSVIATLFTVLLVVLLLFLLGISVKYMKALTYKIGLIMRMAEFREENPEIQVTEEDGSDEEGPDVEEVQAILNNMIARGRSTRFCNIFGLVLDKYNHILVWPCMRKRRNKEYDLLKPPYRFYNFLNTAGVFILWQIIVFVVALMYTVTTSIH